MEVLTLLLHALLVLLEMESGISKLLLTSEAVVRRYPNLLNFFFFFDWRNHTWGKVGELGIASQRALHWSLSLP